MRKFFRVMSLSLALTLFLGACNTDSTSQTTLGSDTPSGTTADSGVDTPDDVALHADPKVYTYRTYLSAMPDTWNGHAWQLNTSDDIMSYLRTGFVNYAPDGEGSWKWEYQAAESVEDITAEFADKEKWGIEDGAKNQVYKIVLRPDQKWDDGTPINAHSHVYGMKELLNPAMKNYRADMYVSSERSIKGAYDYFHSDKAGEPVYAQVRSTPEEGEDLYFNVEEGTALLRSSFETLNKDEGNHSKITTSDGVNLAVEYKDKGYVLVDDTLRAQLEDIAKINSEDPTNWIYLTVRRTGETYKDATWEDVGFFVGDNDLELIWVLERPLSEFNFLVGLTGPGWLVHEGKYEAGKSETGKLVTTNYGTSLDTSASFGPYKIVSVEQGRQIRFDRNENWFGYQIDLFNDRYHADHVTIDILEDPNTPLQLFNSGQLDYIELKPEQLERYRMSEFLYAADESYTYRWVFATDPATLEAAEKNAGDGSNKRVMQYLDFRKAISLSLDRSRIALETTANTRPAYYLFNSIYYYDIENDPSSVYRDSEEAKAAIADLYGLEYGEGKQYADVNAAYDAVTGYNVEGAKNLFQKAYDQAIADGNYTEGQDVNIEIMIGATPSLSADDTRQQDLVNEFLDAATKGTGFEGKVKVTYKTGSRTRYSDVVEGKELAIRGAWGGAIFYPFRTIGVYVDPASVGGIEGIHESNGWDPTTVDLTITHDFNGDGTAEDVTHTLTEWFGTINGGGEFVGDNKTSLLILSRLEKAVLESLQNIPLYTSTTNHMRSQRVKYFSEDYHILLGWGGFARQKFTQDDTEWAAYVEEQGGTLNYE